MDLWKDSVSAVVVALGHLGDVKTAFDLVKGLERHALDKSVFYSLLDAALIGGTPKDVYGTFHYADRSGLVDDWLCSNAIVAFSAGDNPSRWLKVEEYMKRMEAVRVARLETVSDLDTITINNPKKFLHGGGKYGGAMYWWVDPLVSGGMDPELKHVFCKMCKALRDSKLADKFLSSLEKAGEDLEPRSMKILLQLCGQGVRRKRCRGEPLLAISGTSEVDARERLARKKLMMSGAGAASRYFETAIRLGIGLDPIVQTAAAQAFRALRDPGRAKMIIKYSMEHQVVPPPSVFSAVMTGAKENGDKELEKEILVSMKQGEKTPSITLLLILCAGVY